MKIVPAHEYEKSDDDSTIIDLRLEIRTATLYESSSIEKQYSTEKQNYLEVNCSVSNSGDTSIFEDINCGYLVELDGQLITSLKQQSNTKSATSSGKPIYGLHMKEEREFGSSETKYDLYDDKKTVTTHSSTYGKLVIMRNVQWKKTGETNLELTLSTPIKKLFKTSYEPKKHSFLCEYFDCPLIIHKMDYGKVVQECKTNLKFVKLKESFSDDVTKMRILDQIKVEYPFIAVISNTTGRVLSNVTLLTRMIPWQNVEPYYIIDE